MQMTDGERLIAVMLAEVMEALKINKEVDPTLVKSLVIDNAGWALKRKYSGIFSSDSPSSNVVSETSSILLMWSVIEHCIGQLTGAEANTAKNWYWIKFRGFDGNNDDHYDVARTMIEKLDEFQALKGRDLDSHTQSSLPRYRSMYEKFDSYVKAGHATPLSFDTLRNLCS